MHVTLVHVHVKPEQVEDFVQATRLDHRASIQGPGNLRFDVLRLADDPTRFVLYEAYANAEAAAAHERTPHYRRWCDSVAGWMAVLRAGVQYQGLFPEDRYP